MMRVTLWLAGFLLCMLAFQAKAQITLSQDNEVQQFERARELFTKQRYVVAQRLFSEFAASTTKNHLKSDAHYYIAVSAARLKQADAEQLILDYRKDFPIKSGLRQSHYELGKYHFLNKKYRSALYELIEIDPFFLLPEEQDEYYFMTGYGQFYEGNIKEAKPYFKEIIGNQGPYYHLSNYFYGYIAYENRAYEDALASFLKIENQAEFADIIPVYITEVYALTKQYDEVIRYGLDKLNQQNVEKKHVIELLLGQAYFKKNQFEKSFTYYESYEKKKELSADDRYQFGYAAYQQKEYKLALKQFEQLIINEDSLGQNTAFILADCYLKNDKKLEAKNALSFAKNLDFDKKIKEEATYHYAMLSHELKFDKDAMRVFESFIKEYPKSLYINDAKENFTRMLLESNNYKQAFDIIERMDKPTPKIDMAYQRLAYNMGIQYLEVKDYETARVYLNKSLSRPSVPIFKALAFYWIGESLYLQNRLKEASAAYKNFLVVPESAQTPLTATAHYSIAYCEFQAENYKDALYSYEEYFKFPNSIYTKQFNSDANLRMADCYFALGLYDKAIAQYDKVIAINYSDLDYALYQKAMIKGLQDKSLEKIALMAELTKNYKSSGYVDDALYESANEKFIAGNYRQALREFQYLNQDYKNNLYFKVALLKMGLIHYNLDESEEALAIFNKVISEFPSSNESREALTLIKNIYVDLGQADKFLSMIDTMSQIKFTETAKDSTLYNSTLSVLKKGDCKETAKAFNTYLNKFDNGIFSSQAYYYLAECYTSLDSFDAALEAYDILIKRRPNNYSDNALTKASILCFSKDSFQRAIPYLLLREEVSNNSKVLLEVYEGLAKAYLETNQCQNAENYLNKIRTFEEANLEVLERADYTVARCALAAKDYNKALKLFHRVAESNQGSLGAESQYLVAYIYYLKEAYDSSTTAIIKIKDHFARHEYFVAKSFILMADNFSKTDDLFNAKATLKSIIDNYAGADLVQVAKQKLEAIHYKEKLELEKQQQIQQEQKDTIEYNESK